MADALSRSANNDSLRSASDDSLRSANDHPLRSANDHPLRSANDARPAITRIGLGTWVFGGVGWGVQDDCDSLAAILRAAELGVGWIDTAAVYGDGRAERVVGRALSQLREEERPLVFTKGGLRVDGVSANVLRDLSPASLRAECEASLRRLRVERIDLYQLHWPVDDHHAVGRAWETLGELRREGKIRWAGVSNFDTALLRRCAALHPVESVQLPLSLINRQRAADVLPWAAREEAWALVYSPLESGLLTGRFSSRRLATLSTGDWRGRRPQFQPGALLRGEALVELMRPLARELGASLIELAISWALSWPGVSGAIVGARTAAQVEGWVGAAGLRLGEGTLDALAAALARTGVGTGPMRPPPLSR
jgi:aryl-alcohol dehydrogenase-like predicted oxidoreductase